MHVSTNYHTFRKIPRLIHLPVCRCAQVMLEAF
jgi:hypothetical protein